MFALVINASVVTLTCAALSADQTAGKVTHSVSRCLHGCLSSDFLFALINQQSVIRCLLVSCQKTEWFTRKNYEINAVTADSVS